MLLFRPQSFLSLCKDSVLYLGQYTQNEKQQSYKQSYKQSLQFYDRHWACAANTKLLQAVPIVAKVVNIGSCNILTQVTQSSHFDKDMRQRQYVWQDWIEGALTLIGSKKC